MPKNTTGGNKAKKGSNKEGGKSKKNKKMINLEVFMPINGKGNQVKV
jgi:hypothetical protein